MPHGRPAEAGEGDGAGDGDGFCAAGGLTAAGLCVTTFKTKHLYLYYILLYYIRAVGHLFLSFWRLQKDFKEITGESIFFNNIRTSFAAPLGQKEISALCSAKPAGL